MVYYSGRHHLGDQHKEHVQTCSRHSSSKVISHTNGKDENHYLVSHKGLLYGMLRLLCNLRGGVLSLECNDIYSYKYYTIMAN